MLVNLAPDPLRLVVGHGNTLAIEEVGGDIVFVAVVADMTGLGLNFGFAGGRCMF